MPDAVFWSTLLAAIGLPGSFCTARGWLRSAYYLGIAVQFPGCWWDIVTHQVGFLVPGVLVVVMNFYGLRRLKREQV
jgi:hypothetical protein